MYVVLLLADGDTINISATSYIFHKSTFCKLVITCKNQVKYRESYEVPYQKAPLQWKHNLRKGKMDMVF